MGTVFNWVVSSRLSPHQSGPKFESTQRNWVQYKRRPWHEVQNGPQVGDDGEEERQKMVVAKWKWETVVCLHRVCLQHALLLHQGQDKESTRRRFGFVKFATAEEYIDLFHRSEVKELRWNTPCPAVKTPGTSLMMPERKKRTYLPLLRLILKKKLALQGKC